MIRFIATLTLPAAVALLAVPSATAQGVKTESGKIACGVYSNGGQSTPFNGPVVICETSAPGNVGFLQAPMTDYGAHYHSAIVDGAGNFHFGDEGNLGDTRDYLVLSYGQTYDIEGWTTLPTSDGTRFTNDRTGHGMFVSVENVSSF